MKIRRYIPVCDIAKIGVYFHEAKLSKFYKPNFGDFDLVSFQIVASFRMIDYLSVWAGYKSVLVLEMASKLRFFSQGYIKNKIWVVLHSK